MNVLKNMEIIFTVTLALACSAAYVSTLPEAQAGQQASVAIPTVVVSAKRLTPAEKRQSLLEEHAALADNGSARI